jgi:hypothetical protein
MILSIGDGKIDRITTSDFVAEFTYESAEKMPQIVRDAMMKTGKLHPDFPVKVALYGFPTSDDDHAMSKKTDGIGGGTYVHIKPNTTLLIEGIWGGDSDAVPGMDSALYKKWRWWLDGVTGRSDARLSMTPDNPILALQISQRYKLQSLVKNAVFNSDTYPRPRTERPEHLDDWFAGTIAQGFFVLRDFLIEHLDSKDKSYFVSKCLEFDATNFEDEDSPGFPNLYDCVPENLAILQWLEWILAVDLSNNGGEDFSMSHIKKSPLGDEEKHKIFQTYNNRRKPGRQTSYLLSDVEIIEKYLGDLSFKPILREKFRAPKTPRSGLVDKSYDPPPAGWQPPGAYDSIESMISELERIGFSQKMPPVNPLFGLSRSKQNMLQDELHDLHNAHAGNSFFAGLTKQEQLYLLVQHMNVRLKQFLEANLSEAENPVAEQPKFYLSGIGKEYWPTPLEQAWLSFAMYANDTHRLFPKDPLSKVQEFDCQIWLRPKDYLLDPGLIKNDS